MIGKLLISWLMLSRDIHDDRTMNTCLKFDRVDPYLQYRSNHKTNPSERSNPH